MIASIIFGRQPVIIIGDLLVVNRLRFGLPVNRRARSLDRRQMDVIAVRIQCCVLCMLGYPLLGPPCVRYLLTGPLCERVRLGETRY